MIDFAYVPYSLRGIQQFTAGWNTAVVITSEEVWVIPQERKKGSARPLDDKRSKFFRDIFRELSKAEKIKILVLAPNKVKQTTVEKWLPQEEGSDHEKALNA